MIAKITFGGDLHLRTDEAKRGYKGPLFYAHSGDLIISKINAVHGAVTVIDDESDPVAVSSEYPVYGIDRQIVQPYFLRLVVRTSAFKNRLSRIRSGHAKARINPREFEQLELPIPPLAIQSHLVTAYTKALGQAAKLEQDAQDIETASLRAFEDALGVAPPAPLPDRSVFVARFKDVERWSHESILRAFTNIPDTNSLKPMIPLGQMAKVTYGIQKCPANRPAIHARPYLRVANVQRGLLDLCEIKYINVPDEEMSKLRLEVGDVLLCEGNSLDLVGRGAIWHGEINDCVHQNHVLRVRVNPEYLLPEFVLAVINSGHGQAYFRSKAKRTTNLASINSKEVASLPVPALPLVRQQELLDELTLQVDAAQSNRAKAANLRHSAWAAFESALFTTPEETSP